jgi:hypothetical protein
MDWCPRDSRPTGEELSSDRDSRASIYLPLNSRTREIRLAHILPSRGNDNIVEVRLQTVSLDESPVYDALSYCWGDPSITSAIRVNGQEKDVTINLEAALRQFRLQTGDGDGAIFWVMRYASIKMTSPSGRNK